MLLYSTPYCDRVIARRLLGKQKGHNMGGSFEKNTPATKSGKTIGHIRMHINSGEVHFHDDKAKKKCAMSVADYHAAMVDFRSRIPIGGSKTLIGIDGKTSLIMTKVMNDQNEMHADLEIHGIKLSSTFQMLEDLAAGK